MKLQKIVEIIVKKKKNYSKRLGYPDLIFTIQNKKN